MSLHHRRHQYTTVSTEEALVHLKPSIVQLTEGCELRVDNGTDDKLLFKMDEHGVADWGTEGVLQVADADGDVEFQIAGNVRTIAYDYVAGATNRFPHTFIHETKCPIGKFAWPGGVDHYMLKNECDTSGKYFASSYNITLGGITTTTMNRLKDPITGEQFYLVRIFDGDGVQVTPSSGWWTSFMIV